MKKQPSPVPADATAITPLHRPIRIVIVEDETTTRRELVRLLNSHDAIEVVASFANAEAALGQIRRLAPDIVLLDLGLPGMSGSECARRLREASATIRIVVLTKYEDSDHLFEALKAGANGYLLKKFKEIELQRAILDAASGGAPLTGEIAVRVLRYFHDRGGVGSSVEGLAPRELNVLRLLAQGFTYKEIADQLGITYSTVNGYTKHIYSRLHVRSRAEAVARYLPM